MSQSYDAIVVGAGQAGPTLASRLAGKGMKVALIERHLLGGTCVNTGCTPTKALVASAFAAHHCGRAKDLGVVVEGNVHVDFKKVQQRANSIASDSRQGLQKWIDGTDNLTLIRAHARFTRPATIVAGDHTLTAPKIFLNVGARARVPDYPGINEVDTLTNSSILNLETLPSHLVIMGGGYVGVEFAQMYCRFGARVTIVEKRERLLSHEDEDVSDAVREILEEEGIFVRTKAECIRFARHTDGIGLGLQCASGEPEVVGTHVLLAVGRQPNTDDLGLGDAGILTDKRGYIQVDDRLATTANGVWAMGECNGHGAFTHTAYNDYEILAANLLDKEDRKLSDRVPGYAVFIDPPLGRAGITQAEAARDGRKILVAKRPMAKVSRAVEKSETKGFLKIVADAETKQILGAAFLGTGGDEAIHGILDMMHARQPYTVLKWAVPIHPTVSELIPTMLGGLEPPE